MSNCNFNGNYSNANVAAFLPLYSGNIDCDLVGGTLTTNFQPNINQTGTLTFLSVTGNINSNGHIFTTANITSTNGSLNLPQGNILIGGEFVANGIIYGNTDIVAENNVQAVNGNFVSVYTGNIYTDNYYYANGAPFAGAGNSAYSNANVANYLATFNGPMSAGSLNIIGGEVVGANISVTGNVTAAYFNGDGSNLSNIQSNYGNSNVASYLPTYTGALSGANVSVTGNVTGQYILGNAAFLTGLPTAYGNSNVAAYLPTYTGNLSAGNALIANNIYANGIISPTLYVFGNTSVTGNVIGNYFIGNGSQLTGITANSIVGSYSNANVANYLPTFSGNLTANNVSAIGNIQGTYILGNGALLTGITANYGNANVANYLPTFTGNISAGNVSTVGNVGNITGANYVIANAFIGSGANLDLTNLNGHVIPGTNSVFTLGNITNQWKELWVSGNTVYIGNVPVSTDSNTLQVANSNVLSSSQLVQQGNLLLTGNISGNNISATSFEINGQPLTIYGNANVAAYLPTDNTIINIESNISNLQGQTYGNANVAAYLPTYIGTIGASDVNVANTVTATTFIGNFQGNITGNLVVPGANTWVIFNNNGNADSDIGFTYDAATQDVFVGNVTFSNTFIGNSLVIDGNAYITGNANILGNLTYNEVSSITTSNLVLGLANNQTGINTSGAGMVVGNTNEASLLYNYATQSWDSNLSFAATGNLTGNNVFANVVNTVYADIDDLIVTGNTNIGNISFAIATGAQINITSEIISNTLQANNLVASNIGNSGAAYTGATISITGNIVAANIGNTTTAYIGNTISVSGNITGNRFIGNGALLTNLPTSNSIGNGTSNISIATSGGNITGNVNGIPSLRLTSTSVSLGYNAGLTTQGTNGVAIGVSAGNNSQGSSGIAIGYYAGNASQGTTAVAIGVNAGTSLQGNGAVALGINAGSLSQGQYSLALGPGAGYSNQANNTIILNAGSTTFSGVPGQQNSFYVNPIRLDNANSNVVLNYNTATKEVVYSQVGPSFQATATLNASLTYATATGTNVAITSKDWDSAGCFNNTASTVTLNGLSVPAYSFCPNRAGYYYVHGYLSYASMPATAGIAFLYLSKNGVAYKRGVRLPCNTVGIGLEVNDLMYFNGAGDYVTLVNFQNCGSTATAETNGTDFIPTFSAAWIRNA